MEKFINSNFGLRLGSGLLLILVFVYALIYNEFLFLLMMFIASVLAFFELVKMQGLNLKLIFLNIFFFLSLYLLSSLNTYIFIYIIFFLFCFLFPLIPFLKIKQIFLNITPAFYISSFF
ncbi:MAG: hypothetical protein EBW64_05155, partial [Betaproteobacteria bacterium]|nr:hypothetical protein [Betaproteobacteria bacterium]